MGLRKTIGCLSVSLATLLAGFSVQGQAEAAQTDFSDVGSDTPYYEEVNYLVSEGVVEGYTGGEFRPNQTLTRKEAATMVGRALGLDGKLRSTDFPDVKASSYASGYIQSLYQKQYITGTTDGTFQPNRDMNRDEMAYLIAKAFSLDEMDKFLSYTDVNQSYKNYEPINKVTAAGITQGLPDGTFRPAKPISRKDFALMVARSMDEKFRQSTESQSVIDEGVVQATGGLRVRQGPSTNYNIIDKLPNGASVKIYKKVGGWGFIASGSLQGYVSLKYVKDQPVKDQPSGPLEGQVITVDPGHGGSDPGTAAGDLVEKNINLDVAKKVIAYLKKAGADVVMTRNDDTYVSLQKRVDISKNRKADVFVSIHTNACGCDGAEGTETYYHPYTDPADNQTKKSEKLASYIQNRMVSIASMEDRGVKKDTTLYDVGLAVLRENAAPSALVELGFIDGNSDAQKLASSSWRQKAANAIYLGINDYFKS